MKGQVRFPFTGIVSVNDKLMDNAQVRYNDLGNFSGPAARGIVQIFYVSGKEVHLSVAFCETNKPSADVVVVYISGTSLAVEGAARSVV